MVVDGTQPASVNYSIANIDIEKYVEASTEITENEFIDTSVPRTSDDGCYRLASSMNSIYEEERTNEDK